MLPPAIADGWLSIHLCLTNRLRYVEVSDRKELILFTGGLVDSANGLAPGRKALQIGIKYAIAFTFPLFPSFQDGKISELLVVDAEKIVDALFCTIFLAQLLAEGTEALTLCLRLNGCIVLHFG